MSFRVHHKKFVIEINHTVSQHTSECVLRLWDHADDTESRHMYWSRHLQRQGLLDLLPIVGDVFSHGGGV